MASSDVQGRQPRGWLTQATHTISCCLQATAHQHGSQLVVGSGGSGAEAESGGGLGCMHTLMLGSARTAAWPPDVPRPAHLMECLQRAASVCGLGRRLRSWASTIWRAVLALPLFLAAQFVAGGRVVAAWQRGRSCPSAATATPPPRRRRTGTWALILTTCLACRLHTHAVRYIIQQQACRAQRCCSRTCVWGEERPPGGSEAGHQDTTGGTP